MDVQLSGGVSAQRASFRPLPSPTGLWLQRAGLGGSWLFRSNLLPAPTCTFHVTLLSLARGRCALVVALEASLRETVPTRQELKALVILQSSLGSRMTRSVPGENRMRLSGQREPRHVLEPLAQPLSKLIKSESVLACFVTEVYVNKVAHPRPSQEREDVIIKTS